MTDAFQVAWLELSFPWLKRGLLLIAIMVSTLMVIAVYLSPSISEMRTGFLRTETNQSPRRAPSGPTEGNSTRPLPGDVLQQSPAVPERSGNGQIPPGNPYCDKWAVVTRNFPLTDAIKQQEKLQGEWCMVIVGGKNEVPPYNITRTHPNVVYLDDSAQNIMSERYRLITYLPWDHIGRKNVGYLYAIEHGARAVWDFNDDVVLSNSANKHGLPTFPLISTDMVDVLIPNVTEGMAFYDPCPIMGAPHSPCWPRGLRLPDVKDSLSISAIGYLDSIPLEYIGVIQYLAKTNPDVDDKCHLAMHMPFNSDHTRRNLLIVPPKESMTLFNSQASLFYYQSFWMLMLPVSVTDRLSDIRSFIAQRIAWELEIPQYFLLSTPLVNQSRNSDKIPDVDNEADRHNRSMMLVRFLHKWKPSSRDLMNMIEELWIALYERNFIELQDVARIRYWLQALLVTGYNFPKVRQCQESTWPPFDMFIPIGVTHQDEFKNVFLRSLKLFWPKSQANLVMVLDKEMKNRDEFAEALLNLTTDLNSAKIACNKQSQYYGKNGHDRQQLIMFWADNFTDADMVGFVDTDTLFVTVPDSEDLFENEDKPVVIGAYGKPQNGFWEAVPSRTMFSLGKPEALRCMSYFPVIIKTSHLKEMRDYMTALHNATHFDQVFYKIKDKVYSQFNIMCNYLWWFHRDEYAWHVMEREPGWQGVPPPGQVTSFKEAGITHKMLYPKPRVAIHLNYHTMPFKRNQRQNVDFFLRQGYCTYLHTQFSQQSVMMRPECRDLDKQGYNPNLFMFEYGDWQYHIKHQEAFQRRQDRFRRSNSCHAFENKVTNSWKKEICYLVSKFA